MNIDLSSQFNLWAVVVGSGLLGLITHPIVLWARKKIDTNPWQYLVHEDKRATVLSVLSLIGAAAAAIAGNTFENMSALQIAIMAFPYGFTNDAVINRGTPTQSL